MLGRRAVVLMEPPPAQSVAWHGYYLTSVPSVRGCTAQGGAITSTWLLLWATLFHYLCQHRWWWYRTEVRLSKPWWLEMKEWKYSYIHIYVWFAISCPQSVSKGHCYTTLIQSTTRETRGLVPLRLANEPILKTKDFKVVPDVVHNVTSFCNKWATVHN